MRTTPSLSTGSVPGKPMHTGHVCVLGSFPYVVEHLQNALVLVLIWTCVSMPITASYSGVLCGTKTRRRVWERVSALKTTETLETSVAVARRREGRPRSDRGERA